jgi:murein tripeptide amidase MpaA
MQAQQQLPSRMDIAFNRFYDYTEMGELLHKLVAAYPELLSIQSIGKSEQGRDLWLVTMNNPKTGPDTDKPAMWIDGNVHGNEIQAGETVLYTIQYLARSYGEVDSLTKLIDRAAFYFLVSQNPDGRQNWFDQATTPHDFRTG